MNEAIYCLLLFPDRPGLRNPELVGRMQSRLKLVLQNILVPQHPQHSAIFSQLLTIVHDLRTLNTLHTDKFLQQAKVGGGEAPLHPRPASPPSSSHLHAAVTAAGGLLYERVDWDEQADRDSTGSRSPQSSSDSSQTGGLGHSISSSSYQSMEDLRRSPIGSVSSSESLGSSETFSKLSVNDLKIHGVGSVLLHALTSPALSQLGGGGGGCPARKRDISRLSCEAGREDLSPTSQQGVDTSHQKFGAVVVTSSTAPNTTTTATVAASSSSCPFKARKLDSPSDSGIDSPKAQGSQSTNTSVCSSPRSSLEEAAGGREVGEEDRHSAGGNSSNNSSSSLLEDQHPLLKRALQQPPQPFNLGVTGFQDEVYKPHKKFRHSGRRDGDTEPTSTQQESAPSLQHHSAAASPLVLTHSILASQLAAPPSYSQPPPRRSSPPPPHQSLLASTLSRPLSVPRPRREEERNELLAALILDGGRYRTGGSGHHSNNKSQTLLMCAPTTASSHHHHIPLEGWAAANSGVQPAAPTRHLPVPVAPSHQPTSSCSPRPLEPPKGAVAALPSSHLRSALTDSPQPLNLSTRTPPPPPPSTNTDIQAEA
jgi:nuclear receptor subfamily 1 group D protein 3